MASCMSTSSAQTTPQLLALCSHVSPEMALAATSSALGLWSLDQVFIFILHPWPLPSGSPLPLLQLCPASPFAPSPACWCTHSFPGMAHPHWGTSAPRTTEIDQTCTPSSQPLLPTEPAASWCPAVFTGTSRWPCRLSTSPLEHLVGFPLGYPFHRGTSPSTSTQV